MSGSDAARSAGAYIVQWSILARWDIKSARAASFRAAYPDFVPLGEFIEEATEIVRPWEKPDHPWPVYGVNNKTGVELSHHQAGQEFNAPYKRIKQDWFFHNPTRANVGSLGRVSVVPEDALTSPEYQVWRIKDGLTPDFVEILIQLPVFLELIECHRVGAVKERLFVQNLMEIPVPKIALKAQQAIVAHWQGTQDRNTVALKAADVHEAHVCRTFLEKLGLSDHSQGITQRAFAQSWSAIERWSLGYIRQSSGNLSPEGGIYPVAKLGDVVADLSNGWSPQCLDRRAEDHEWGVLKLGAVSFGSFNDEENKALPPTLSPQPSLEVQVGDVLISRANVPRLVGACAYVTATRPKLLLCDKIFRVVPKSKPIIIPQYIAEVMKLPHLRRQIESSVTGSSPTMQNITKPALLALQLPLPPLLIQEQLVAEVTAAREQIAAERAAAAKLAADTAREVEEMILGRRPVAQT